MTAETRRDLEAIEHLDFAPMCGASGVASCGGINPAAYLAVYRDPCCVKAAYVCSPCVAAKIARGRARWHCVVCLLPRPVETWLEKVTLHPLGATP